MGRFAGRETRWPVRASFHHFPYFFVSSPLLPPDLGITRLDAFGIGTSYASVCPSAKPFLVESVLAFVPWGWTSGTWAYGGVGRWWHAWGLACTVVAGGSLGCELVIIK